MKLKNKGVIVNLSWDGDTASLTEERTEKLLNGLEVDFLLEIEVEEKTYRSADWDVPDDVDIVVSRIAISDIKFYDNDGDEVLKKQKDYEEMEAHIRESIVF